MTSLKDQILAAKDIKHKDVFIEEWGVTIRVMGFTDEQLGSWRAKSSALKAKQRNGDQVDMDIELKHRRAELLVHCLRDPETGARIFTDSDAPRLARKHAGVLQALDVLATSLSGLDKSYKDQVAEAEKVFESGQS